ncbi:plasmid pRiA4b ORF-3 family protein [Sporosarcina limicola]|uniref:Plasmid pRiA4b Orf3-like domain-containing protein n=1 Tax=Sporosarcina limicola TaxID=34101 RepID=A0A927MNZ4_9BACL|nr:plasmid pRiA4b ORF-3 family protein [Sporosarcina limicola]MBE1554696.1 hypothetical protein [Sporosarcina limicola]
MLKAYQLLITLVDTHIPVWRRVIIPAETTFKRLHDTIQFSMGWQDYHLYQFDIEFAHKLSLRERILLVGDDEAYEEHQFRQLELLKNSVDKNLFEDPSRYNQWLLRSEVGKAKIIKLPRYVEANPEFSYTYDFGDDWKHTIQLENIINTYDNGYPVLLEGEGACPPEDVGGPPGYEHFQQVWNNPSHSEYEDIRSWGQSQMYEELDIEKTNRNMSDVLKLKRIKK